MTPASTWRRLNPTSASAWWMASWLTTASCPISRNGFIPVPLAKELSLTVPTFPADVVDPERPWRHDSEKLAHVLLRLLEERTGPLDMPPIDRAQSPTHLN